MNGARGGKDFSQLQPELAAASDGIRLEHFRVPILQAANVAETQLAMAAPITDEQMHQMVGILRGFGHEQNKEELVQRRWFRHTQRIQDLILKMVSGGTFDSERQAAVEREFEQLNSEERKAIPGVIHRLRTEAQYVSFDPRTNNRRREIITAA